MNSGHFPIDYKIITITLIGFIFLSLNYTYSNHSIGDSGLLMYIL